MKLKYQTIIEISSVASPIFWLNFFFVIYIYIYKYINAVGEGWRFKTKQLFFLSLQAKEIIEITFIGFLESGSTIHFGK